MHDVIRLNTSCVLDAAWRKTTKGLSSSRTVATGTPLGICTIDNNESLPEKADVLCITDALH